MKLSSLAGMLAVGTVSLATMLHGATRTWDNDSEDGLWSTESNWSDNTKPISGDSVIMANGDTVNWNSGESGQSLPGGLMVNLSGNSTLREGSVIRLNGASLTVGAGSTLTGGFWDLGGAHLSFEDGAVCTVASWEQKFDNTFTFELGASGFATLTPGTFQIAGHNDTTMSNATYIADMAGYTGGAGVITLVDFAADNSGTTPEEFLWASRIVTNAAVYPNSTLAWNDTSDAILLNVIDAYWDGDAGDGLWTNAANWRGDVLPAAGNVIHISNGDTVEWDGNGNLPGGCTVNLAGNSTLYSSGVLRCNGATLNVAAGCALTSDVNDWFDLNGGTVNFEDGATNSVHYWEHKGQNTFNFTLSETGFEALTPYQLRFGSGATWAGATYNIEISDYDRNRGKTIVLMDFTTSLSGGTFDPSADSPTVNVTGLEGGTLKWDAAGHRLILQVVPIQGSLLIVY